jgi:integrase
MTPTTPTRKPRKKPRKQTVLDFKGWKIRRIAPDVWQSDNMGKFWHKDESTGKLTKKRERHYHESPEAAKGYILGKQAEYNEHGAGATALTAVQREECLQAYRDLAGRATVAQAVKFWTAHHPDGQAATLKEMVAAWIAEQTKNGHRPGTIKLNRQRLDGLMRAMGDDTPCVTVTTQALKGYLDGLACAPVTRNGARRCLRAFFQYCVDREIMEANPVVKIKPAKLDAKLPDFMTDKAVESFMHKLAELHPDSVPAFSIAFWCGLRPTEIHGQYGLATEAVTLAKKAVENANKTLENAKKRGKPRTIREAERSLASAREALRAALAEQDRKRAVDGVIGGLQWEDVNLRDGVIRVRPETSKTRSARLVNISPNLATWLLKYYRATGPVSPSPVTVKRHRTDVMKELKMKAWVPDWPRHTFATMHFAQHQNRDKLAAQMGHTGASGVLEKHYKGLATKEQAERFWAILPADAVKQDTQPETATQGA